MGLHCRGSLHTFAAGIAALAMLSATPAQASGMSGAEKLRRLDIMLMVTGLRCRLGRDGFQGDYARFTALHADELVWAHDTMRAELEQRHGPAGAQEALDRLSVRMANAYGGGHPWLTCAQLGMVARNLADARGIEPLEEAADQLLAESEGGRLALARR